jgi:hypothetical protein
MSHFRIKGSFIQLILGLNDATAFNVGFWGLCVPQLYMRKLQLVAFNRNAMSLKDASIAITFEL